MPERSQRGSVFLVKSEQVPLGGFLVCEATPVQGKYRLLFDGDGSLASDLVGTGIVLSEIGKGHNIEVVISPWDEPTFPMSFYRIDE